MTIFRSEETLVALIALVIPPWAAWTVRRSLRSGQVPIGRAYVRRDERPGAFVALIAFYLVAGLLALAIACDLLLGLNMRDSL